MSNLEVAYNSDQEVSENHSKLIEAVAQLDKKQRVNKAERSEPTLEVSEFHLVKSGITNKDAVQVQDLVKSLGQKGYQSQITKKLQSVQRKSKTISKPLEKSSTEKVKMRFGFERTLKDLSRWNAIVARNRTATNLFFPLRTKQKMKKDSSADFINHLRLKSDLQRKLEELDPPKLKEPLPEEKAKQEDKLQMTLEEVKMERNKIAEHRARQSYEEAKAHRLRKIKSKKFHRVERKKKTKEQLIEFQKLQETNPEEALMKLEQLDKSRAEERMSLRHKNTGHWAKNKLIRAKYDKETQLELAEQLSLSKKLTQKVMSTRENDEDDGPLISSHDNEKKPCDDIKKSEVNDYFQLYLKFHEKKRNKSEEEKTVAEVVSESKSSVDELKVDNTLKKQFPNKPNKAGDTVTSAVISMNQKTQESVEDKTSSKKANTNYITISDEIESKKKKAKLCNKKNKAQIKNKYNAGATSIWHVEELQCNKQTDSKISKVVDIDDMFDSVEENMKYKVNLEMQKIKRKLETENKMNEREKKENKENEDYMPNLEFKSSKQKLMLDLPLEETTSKENSQQDTDMISLRTTMFTQHDSTSKSNSCAEKVDLQKNAMKTKLKHIQTQIPDSDAEDVEDAEYILDDNTEKDETFYKLMDEVFEDDDAEEEFKKEKEKEIKDSQPENINTVLPGWGSWAGTNIKEKKMNRKNRQFIMKFPKDAPRKDENKGDVIIFEGENQKLKEHLVSELPYPFTTVKDFEASIRAPLGRTFVPENAHRRLIQPPVVTKSGQVIEPMTEDVLLEKQWSMKRRINKQKEDSVKNNKKKRE